MSLFFRRGEQRSVTSWGDLGWSSHAPQGRSTYLTPVFAAIRHIVDYGSTLPLDSYRRVSERERALISPPQLLARQDGPGRPGVEQWIGQALYGIVVHGNAVGWVNETDGFGFPTDVAWLQESDWQWSDASREWFVFGHPVPASRIVHVPWLVPTGKKLGMSPVEHYAAITAAGLSAQEYADLKRGGGVPPAMLKNTRLTLDSDQSAKVQSRAVASFASGKPFVTGADWDLSILSIPPNHAQFIETLKLSANQIAGIYGIEPTEIGGEAGNSQEYTTEERRQLRRAADLRPYLVRVERAVSRLLPNKQFIRFNIDATLRTDIKTRTEVLGLQIADGRKSVNEARTLEDDQPVTGGDFHNVPAPRQEPTTRDEGVAP